MATEDHQAAWSDAATGWARWAARAAAWLEPATERMLDVAGITAGHRVLDLACGSGEQSLLAARRVGPQGHVLATDMAASMIAATAANAGKAKLTQIATECAAADAAGAKAEPFDAVICRLGLMLFPDPAAALRNALARLKPGGGFAALVHGPVGKNPFNALPLEILARHGRKPAPATPGDTLHPGIFALADGVRLKAICQSAGFTDVQVTEINATRRLPDAAAATAMIREGFAVYRALVADLPAAFQLAAWEEVAEALRRFETAEGFVAPCVLNLVAARKPEEPGLLASFVDEAASNLITETLGQGLKAVGNVAADVAGGILDGV